jgi:hypothetical protein
MSRVVLGTPPCFRRVSLHQTGHLTLALGARDCAIRHVVAVPVHVANVELDIGCVPCVFVHLVATLFDACNVRGLALELLQLLGLARRGPLYTR